MSEPLHQSGAGPPQLSRGVARRPCLIDSDELDKWHLRTPRASAGRSGGTGQLWAQRFARRRVWVQLRPKRARHRVGLPDLQPRLAHLCAPGAVAADRPGVNIAVARGARRIRTGGKVSGRGGGAHASREIDVRSSRSWGPCKIVSGNGLPGTCESPISTPTENCPCIPCGVRVTSSMAGGVRCMLSNVTYDTQRQHVLSRNGRAT